MKDFTTTSFGLIVAYMLPGLVTLSAITVWLEKPEDVIKTVFNANAEVGLVLAVGAAALVLGLTVNVFRWVFFEKLLCRDYKLDKDLFSKLVDEHKLQAFLMVIEETFRYHQFYGSMVILIPFIFLSWLRWFDVAVGHDAFFMTVNVLFLMRELLNGLLYVKASRAPVPETKRRTKNQLLIGTAVVVALHFLWLFLYIKNSPTYTLFIVSLGFAMLGIAVGSNAMAALERYSERGNSLKGA